MQIKMMKVSSLKTNRQRKLNGFVFWRRKKNTHSDALHKHAKRKSHRQCNVLVFDLDIFVSRFVLWFVDFFLFIFWGSAEPLLSFFDVHETENFDHQCYSNLAWCIPDENVDKLTKVSFNIDLIFWISARKRLFYFIEFYCINKKVLVLI